MTEEEIAAKAEELAALLEAVGRDSGDLDDLVHETASKNASNVNNDGMFGQLQYLLENRWTPEEIKGLVMTRADRISYERVQYEKEVWTYYRLAHWEILYSAGLSGPDDMDKALESDFVVSPGDGTEDDPPVLLGEYVLHTLTAFAAAREEKSR